MQSLSIVNDFAKARVAKPPPDEPRINGFSDAFRQIVHITSQMFDSKFGCALVPAYHARLTSLKCVPGSEIDTLLHFRKARETMRAGYVYALEKIMNGSAIETVFFDFMTTLNLFNLDPKEVENIVQEVLEETKKIETP